MAALVILTAGCQTPIPHPARSLAEYDNLQTSHPQEYTPLALGQLNAQRVMDEDLPTDQRIESFHLAVHLLGRNPDLINATTITAGSPDCPMELRDRIVAYLGRTVAVRTRTSPATPSPNAYATVASRTEPIAPRHGKPSVSIRPARVRPTYNKVTISDRRSPRPEPEPNFQPDLSAGPKQVAPVAPRDLAKSVKAWAKEQVGGVNEKDHIALVERIGEDKWYKVLLDGLNSRHFNARGSAAKILAARLTAAEMRANLRSMVTHTPAIEAMKLFANRMDYVPASGAELLACVRASRNSRDDINQAAKLFRKWQKNYRYQFNIRDLHLLGRLGRDPLRRYESRNMMIAKINRSLARRRHITGWSAGLGTSAGNLTIGDLWNLKLLNEMLRNRRTVRGLAVLAKAVRSDHRSPRGGVIRYKNGTAGPILYTRKATAPMDDLVYNPSTLAKRAQSDAICRFHACFRRDYNEVVANPTADERRDARHRNSYRLVLTSIKDASFVAFYLSPTGEAVSLGIYSFGK